MKRPKPSPAAVIAGLALFFALGGSAVAASRYIITSTSQIKPSVLAKLDTSIQARVITGLRGATGITGTKGVTGPQGTQGPAGPVGSAGAQGSQGASGGVGPAGPAGATGVTGPVGPSSTSTVVLITGPTEAITSGSTVAATALCPTGDHAIAGGGYTSGTGGLSASQPSDPGRAGWAVISYSASVANENAYAVCAPTGGAIAASVHRTANRIPGAALVTLRARVAAIERAHRG